MIDLLSERSVFATIGAGIGNYYQLSGTWTWEAIARGSVNYPRRVLTLVRYPAV